MSDSGRSHVNYRLGYTGVLCGRCGMEFHHSTPTVVFNGKPHHSYCAIVAERDALKADCEDLRDAMRLILGLNHPPQLTVQHIPWRDIPQADVDGWLKRIRKLKKGG